MQPAPTLLRHLTATVMHSILCFSVVTVNVATTSAKDARPNVVLILTDDQGYSDVGFNGNPVVRTPILDRLASSSIVLDRFYVQPMCTATRASLMTGRDHYRTGVTDTQEGMSVVRPDEVTIAEALRAGGYRTGLVGKWHLGDNAPSRPQDQGFDYVLTLVGGMIGNSYNPQDGNSYFDPVLIENGKSQPFVGYANDIFTDAALRFIEESDDHPFFLYLAPVVPHHPLTAPERDIAPYRAMGLSEDTARFYAMISRLDTNVGRVLQALEKQGKMENTLILFLGDNGTSTLHQQSDLWESGLRGRKTYTYEGGIRVPMIIRPPASGNFGVRRNEVTSVNDIMPTILDYCGLPPASNVDGLSLRPLLEGSVAALPPRSLFFQFHRGLAPEKFRSMAVLKEDLKLVQAVGRAGQPFRAEAARFELFHLKEDPREEHDLAAQRPAVVQTLREEYEAWFADVTARGFDPVRTWIGDDSQNPVMLTRQDWRGGGLDDLSSGCFELEVRRAGTYRFTFRWSDLFSEAHPVHIRIGDRTFQRQILYAESACRLDDVYLPAGPIDLEAWVEVAGEKRAIRFALVERVSDAEVFARAEARSWRPVFFDSGSGDWNDRWFLDGQVGTVTNDAEGMTLRAGPEALNDAHHMVLWTKESFAGDVKIEFDYTRLDDATNFVNILYIQATGSGEAPYVDDIFAWRILRDVPAMSAYFNHMNTYHVSFAAFPNDESTVSYIRGRRYVPQGQGLDGTELVPDYFPEGLFERGVPHHITAIKQDRDLFLHVRNATQDTYCHFANLNAPVIKAGRIGLRHMFTRVARYRNIRISTL